MLKKIWRTLSEPRFITGATITAYLIVLVLAVDVAISTLPHYPLIFWTPAVFMTVGVTISLPAAWFGGRSWARWELISLPLTIAGLLGGVVIEATELWDADFAGHLLIALIALVLIAVIVRWTWLRRHYEI